MSSETAETTTREMESRCPRTPIGHSIKGCGRLRTTTELSLQLDILQKQHRTRIIYSQAITANDSIYRKIEIFGPIRSTLLGTERRHLGRPNLANRLVLSGGHPWSKGPAIALAPGITSDLFTGKRGRECSTVAPAGSPPNSKLAAIKEFDHESGS